MVIIVVHPLPAVREAINEEVRLACNGSVPAIVYTDMWYKVVASVRMCAKLGVNMLIVGPEELDMGDDMHMVLPATDLACMTHRIHPLAHYYVFRNHNAPRLSRTDFIAGIIPVMSEPNLSFERRYELLGRVLVKSGETSLLPHSCKDEFPELIFSV